MTGRKYQAVLAHMADLAAKGSTVAIAAFDDPAYDFYLLKVTSNGVEELEEPMTDDYSCQYPSGSAFLKGHFFLRENLQDMNYTLDTKRLAVVYAGTVRAICTDVSVKKKIEMSQSTSCLCSNLKRSLDQCKSCTYLFIMVKKSTILLKPVNLCNWPRPQGIMGS